MELGGCVDHASGALMGWLQDAHPAVAHEAIAHFTRKVFLPMDLICLILSHVLLRDVSRVRRVCRRWNACGELPAF